MSSRLAALALLIMCPRCQIDAWSCQGDDMDGALVCHSCHTAYPWHDGVLDLGNVNEDPNVAEERVAVRRTERNAALGGINDEFEDLSRAEGALKEAILALPYGNNSRYYAEPGTSATSDQRRLRSTSWWSISSCAPVTVCSILGRISHGPLIRWPDAGWTAALWTSTTTCLSAGCSRRIPAFFIIACARTCATYRFGRVYST